MKRVKFKATRSSKIKYYDYKPSQREAPKKVVETPVAVSVPQPQIIVKYVEVNKCNCHNHHSNYTLSAKEESDAQVVGWENYNKYRDSYGSLEDAIESARKEVYQYRVWGNR